VPSLISLKIGMGRENIQADFIGVSGTVCSKCSVMFGCCSPRLEKAEQTSGQFCSFGLGSGWNVMCHAPVHLSRDSKRVHPKPAPWDSNATPPASEGRPSSRTSHRRRHERPRGCRSVRSNPNRFTEFCNSQCVSHFAAPFIVVRTETSVAETCK